MSFSNFAKSQLSVLSVLSVVKLPGQATPMNSTMRLAASSRMPQSASSSGTMPSSSAGKVLYWLESKPTLPLWA
jgi:hypothetical protein